MEGLGSEKILNNNIKTPEESTGTKIEHAIANVVEDFKLLTEKMFSTVGIERVMKNKSFDAISERI